MSDGVFGLLLGYSGIREQCQNSRAECIIKRKQSGRIYLEKSQPGPGRKEEKVRVASEKVLAKKISSIKASQCFASQ